MSQSPKNTTVKGTVNQPAADAKARDDAARHAIVRRTLAQSGLIPDATAHNFSEGTAAVMTVVGLEIIRRQFGPCTLYLETLALRSRGSISTVERGLKTAAGVGLLTIGRGSGAPTLIATGTWVGWLRKWKDDPHYDRVRYAIKEAMAGDAP